MLQLRASPIHLRSAPAIRTLACGVRLFLILKMMYFACGYNEVPLI